MWDRMAMRRARIALLVVMAAGAIAALAPAQAGAFESYYYCTLKPVGQWCDGRANGSFDGLHSWDYHQGWYPGAWDGSVEVCEHVWKPSTGGELGGGGFCASDWIDHYYGNVQCTCYEAEVKQHSGGPHSINGHADATF
jgi:hypothetical protein